MFRRFHHSQPTTMLLHQRRTYVALQALYGKPFSREITTILKAVSKEKKYTSPYWFSQHQLKYMCDGNVTVLPNEEGVVLPTRSTNYYTSSTSPLTAQRQFTNVLYNAQQTTDPEALTMFSQTKGKYFIAYEPVDASIGLEMLGMNRMTLQAGAALRGVEFRSVLWIQQEDLELLLPDVKVKPNAPKPVICHRYRSTKTTTTTEENESTPNVTLKPVEFYHSDDLTDSNALANHVANRIARKAFTREPYPRDSQRRLQQAQRENPSFSNLWMTRNQLDSITACTVAVLADAIPVTSTFKDRIARTDVSIDLFNTRQTTKPAELERRAQVGLMLSVYGKPLQYSNQQALYDSWLANGFTSAVWVTEIQLQTLFAQRSIKPLPNVTPTTIVDPDGKPVSMYNACQTTEPFTIERFHRTATGNHFNNMRNALTGKTFPEATQIVLREHAKAKGYHSNFWFTESNRARFDPQLALRAGEMPLVVSFEGREGYDINMSLFNLDQLEDVEAARKQVSYFYNN